MESTRRCSVENCDRKHFGKGYCNTHYYRLRRNGTLTLKVRAEYAPRATLRGSPCEAPGCEREARGNAGDLKVCGMHYKRWNRHGDVNVTRKAYGPPNPHKRKCEVSGCTELEDGWAGHCKKHDTRRRRHGDPSAYIPHSGRDFPRGEAHPHWNHDGSYGAVHQRLRAQRGAASTHLCIECDGRAAQWAYQHEAQEERTELLGGSLVPFSTNLDDYAPMCVPCHKRMDLERVNGKEKASRILR